MSALTLATIPDLPGAACVGADVDLWHAPEGVGEGRGAETDEQRKARVAKAKAICAGCPVRAACLAWAEQHDERHGIWGGVEREGKAAKCGTARGARQHRRVGTPMCDPCRLAEARERAARVRKPNQRKAPAERPECGTREGAALHRAKNELVCPACYRKRPSRQAGAEPKRPRPEPVLRPECGTPEGKSAHLERRERLCDACRAVSRRPVPECGTTAAVSRHVRRGEPLCDACLTASRLYQQAQRRAAGVKEFQPAACGTTSGYNRHLRRDETPCDDCRAARRAYIQGRKAAKSAGRAVA